MAVKQSGGHHARAAVPKQRRTDIWDHVFNTFQSKIPRGKWCTKEEIVKASGGKHGVIFSVEELAEVMRGKKHKDTLGIDSNKVDGEWQYRFNQVGATKTAASKLPHASPAKSSASTPVLTKMSPAKPTETKKTKQAKQVKPTPSKAKAKGTPRKRNAPLRPRAKSPHSASKSPVARSSVSRKRGPVKMDASDGLNMETHLRPGSAKKPRVGRTLGSPTAAVTPTKVPSGNEEGPRSGGKGGADIGVSAGEESGSGWGCAIM
eukprot:jgi/Undpi1/9112/HiC_scaffold_26.g11570.m1